MWGGGWKSYSHSHLSQKFRGVDFNSSCGNESKNVNRENILVEIMRGFHMI